MSERTEWRAALRAGGAVAGYLELLQKHGTLPPAVVLAPARTSASDPRNEGAAMGQD